jgi:signal transduction histidine kinase
MPDLPGSIIRSNTSVEALEQRRVHQLFRAIVLVSVALTGIFTLVMVIIGLATAWTFVFSAGLSVIILVMLRAVTPKQAAAYSLVMTTLFWLAITAGVLRQTLPPTTAALSYVMVVMVAGLLRGGRPAMAFAALSVGALGGLYWLTDMRIIEPYATNDFRLEAIWLVAVLAQGDMVLALAHRSIQRGFRYAQQAQEQLEAQNQRLEREIEEHRQTQAQLLEAERARADLEKDRAVIETRHRFISLVSHEFRTPLSIILSSKELIQFYGDRIGAEAKDSHFQKIGEQVTYMTEMLNDVMMVSKAQAKLLECVSAPVDLGAFLKAAIQQSKQQAEGNLHQFDLTLTLPPGDYLLDEKLLKHIVYNLLSNAVKYSPEGGIIRVNVKAVGDEIELQVSDQGIGIPEAHLPHLFEHFQRGENVGQIQGTGLGLSIVKSGVEAHGGTISVNSRMGEGTTFIIRLPLRRAEAAVMARAG